ncbi:hypothetical protein UA08_09496 [Talaromyces atroroseus]|uniref:Methyltransferase domain-containing protein n=1 Tax=Talaromyces atroroseus TaxID=1441469 RepID=A0A1Q5Q612_TALAT|nr:hypothetical protein UA08_09496 [Talaromyces atroroseus]OKL55231.1 hypothetical protein UA08_09496 [Talaromyces atroroseus]
MAEDDHGYYSDDSSTTSMSDSVDLTYMCIGREYSDYFKEYLLVYLPCWYLPLTVHSLPVDEEELRRLEYQHDLRFLISQDEKLYQAPLCDPGRILDIGTGTGVWAIEIGDKYPSAEVEGIDMLHLQPQMVPSNVRFVIDNLENLDTYKNNHWHHVHARDLNGFLSDAGRFSRDVFDILAPGGYFERVELDRWTIPQNKRYPCLSAFHRLLTQTLKNPLESSEDLVQSLEKAGFKSIQKKEWTIVLSKGNSSLEYFIQSLYVYGLRFFTDDLQWNILEFNIFIALIRNEIMAAGFKLNLYSVYGQKPSTGL